MTAFTVQIAPDNTSATTFRTWALAIFNTIISGGWVQAADTGQINFGTVTVPVTVNTSAGYVILKMNDTLQATTPCFLKLEFGTGASTTYPVLYVSVGTGTDGAGALSGVTSNSNRIQVMSYANSATYPCKFSIDTNRLIFSLWVGAAQVCLVSIERTHDSSGADTSTGIVVFLNGLSAGVISYTIIPGVLTYCHSYWNATLPVGLVTNAWGLNVYTYPVRSWGQGETSPSSQVIVYFPQDLTQYNLMPITMWDGVTRPIYPLGGLNSLSCTYGYTSTSVGMRFD